jgi:preprotein translocase subunit SecG
MKADTSLNLMLVAFCIVLIGFVLLNNKLSHDMYKKQAELEKNSANHYTP